MSEENNIKYKEREQNNPWKYIARLERENATLRGKIKIVKQRMHIMGLEQSLANDSLRRQLTWHRNYTDTLLKERHLKIPFYCRRLVKELEQKLAKAQEMLAENAGELRRVENLYNNLKEEYYKLLNKNSGEK